MTGDVYIYTCIVGPTGSKKGCENDGPTRRGAMDLVELTEARWVMKLLEFIGWKRGYKFDGVS